MGHLIEAVVRASADYDEAAFILERKRACFDWQDKTDRRNFDAAVDKVNEAELRRNKAESALIEYLRKGLNDDGQPILPTEV